MSKELFISLLNNITLLLALGFLYSLCAARWGDWRTQRGRVVAGVLFGAVAMAGMIFPLYYSPGLTFDGRTILLGIVGLFGGWHTAAIAAVMTGALRIWQGGVGQWAGLATILSSAALGILFNHLRDQYSWELDSKFLYGFGWLVHLVMLICMLLLPDSVRWKLLADIAAPVLIIYPLATMLYGRLLLVLEERTRATEILRESEEKYRQLFEMESDALFLIDNRTGDIYDVNRSAVDLYGYSREELLRMKNTDLSAEPDETRTASIKAISADCVKIPVRYHRKKDGTEFPVEIMATSLIWKGRSVHIPAIRDITERMRTETELQHRTEIQMVLREIAEALVATTSLEELYLRVYQLIGRVLPAQHFRIHLLDEVTNEISVPFNADQVSAVPPRRPMGRGMTEYVMRRGQAVHVNPAALAKLTESGEYAWDSDLKLRIRHYLGAPLLDHAGKPFGVISLILTEDVPGFRAEDREVLSIIASQVAVAIERKQDEERIRENEARLRVITDSARDAIIMLNPQAEICFWNPAAAAIFGYQQAEVLGENFQKLLLLPQRESLKRQFLDFLAAGRFEDAGITTETEAIRSDGRIIKVEASLSSIQLQNGRHAIGIIRDITQRSAEQEKIEYLSFHDQLTGLFNRRFYEEELARLATQRNLPLTLVIADVNGLKLTNDAFGHSAGDNLLKKLARILKEVCRQDDIVARIGGDEFVMLLPQTNAEEAAGIVRRISNVIQQEDKEFVILSVSFGWATQVSVGTELQEIFKQAEDNMYRNKLSESDSMRNSTIHVIVKTLNEKNAREEMHSSRVSEFCRAIGKAMTMNPHEVNGLRTVGLLHDIGKIGIDENVLNKDGALTDDEWREMKRHPEIGFRILGAVTDFSHLARAVLEHHERWDGGGYPKGLKEREICLEARILAVADAFDAMTGGRPYRQVMTSTAAAAELIRHAGSQFDPVIARVFVEKVLGEAWDRCETETA